MPAGDLYQLLLANSRLLNRRAQQRLSLSGISSGQPRLLNYLFDHDGCIQNELAQNCDLKPATVTHILAGMEKSGLVFRLSDKSDRRILRVFLTEKGLEAHHKIQKIFHLIEKECFRAFSDQEKEQVWLVLNRLSYNLKKNN